MKARIACFKISDVMLRELLHLPEGTLIHGTRDDCGDGAYPRTVTVFIEHPDLKEVEFGSAITDRTPYPEISPTFSRQDSVKLASWGQD